MQTRHQRIGQETKSITGLVGVLGLDPVVRRLALDAIERLDDLRTELLVRRVRVLGLGRQDREVAEDRRAEIHQGLPLGSRRAALARRATALSSVVVALVVTVVLVVVVAFFIVGDGPVESAFPATTAALAAAILPSTAPAFRRSFFFFFEIETTTT